MANKNKTNLLHVFLLYDGYNNFKINRNWPCHSSKKQEKQKRNKSNEKHNLIPNMQLRKPTERETKRAKKKANN